MEVKLRVVKLFITLELGDIFLLGVAEVELNSEGIFFDNVSIAFAQVPLGFAFVAIEDVLAFFV